MDLNTIQSDGRWGDVAAFINANFEKIRLELMKLRHASILTFCKGYFSTASRFLEMYPSGKTGEYAFVGIPWPGTVYEWVDTAWVDTGVVPQIGDAVFIELLKRHIDNETIYWDDTDRVIKSAGGGDRPEETFSITVGVNPANVGQCAVEAEGAMSVVSDATGASWTVRAGKGSTVRVIIVPETGYQVQQLNVDTVSQGAVSEYTFENLDADHTMYVWMEEVLVQTDTDFLTRSDLPGVYYSSLGVCLASLKDDYPDGLAQDVTVSCVKKATEVRGSEHNSQFGIWSSRLADWNKGSLHTLTIDGNSLYTLDCRWLGGLLFENVDNVFIKGVSILDYCNFSGQNTPEEISAIMVRSNDDTDKVKNVALYGCAFNGYYVDKSGKQAHAWYCMRFKNTANVVIDSCTLSRAGAVGIYMSGIECAEVTRSTLQADYYINAAGVGHSSVLTVKGSNAFLNLSDNVIDGEGMIEYACSIDGVAEMEMSRNTVRNCPGQPFSINSTLLKLTVGSNLFYNNITGGQYAYIRRIFGCTDIRELIVRNNTVYLDGSYTASQEFMAGGTFDRLVNCNNIYINKLGKAYAVFACGGVKAYESCNNIYASPFYNDNPAERFAHFYPVKTENNGGSFLDFSFEGRKLSEYQVRGYEAASVALGNADAILNADTGAADYKLLESLKDTCLSNKEQSPEFDIDYLRVAGDSISAGAYNLFGVQWDESSDAGTGYEGVNMADRAMFDDSALYIVPTDDTVTVKVNCRNRNLFIRSLFTSGNGHSLMRFGRAVTASLQCTYDRVTGMYMGDNDYVLTIKKENYV